jgi:hypothetical protein
MAAPHSVMTAAGLQSTLAGPEAGSGLSRRDVFIRDIAERRLMGRGSSATPSCCQHAMHRRPSPGTGSMASRRGSSMCWLYRKPRSAAPRLPAPTLAKSWPIAFVLNVLESQAHQGVDREPARAAVRRRTVASSTGPRKGQAAGQPDRQSGGFSELRMPDNSTRGRAGAVDQPLRERCAYPLMASPQPPVVPQCRNTRFSGAIRRRPCPIRCAAPDRLTDSAR